MSNRIRAKVGMWRRPVFFNLAQIQMPVGALTSITHRVTGVLRALGIPFSIYILDLSWNQPSL